MSSAGTVKTRSRLGCLTCRQRKKRCNEVKPICEACARLSLECRWTGPLESPRLLRQVSVTRPSKPPGDLPVLSPHPFLPEAPSRSLDSEDDVLPNSSPSTVPISKDELYSHYQNSLSWSVTERKDDPTARLDPFQALVASETGTEHGAALYQSLLAWGARHLSNMGSGKSEEADTLFSNASDAVRTQVSAIRGEANLGIHSATPPQLLALIAAILALNLCKRDRGDTLGWATLRSDLGWLAKRLFLGEDISPEAGKFVSMRMLGVLVRHDCMSSVVMVHGRPLLQLEDLSKLERIRGIEEEDTLGVHILEAARLRLAITRLVGRKANSMMDIETVKGLYEEGEILLEKIASNGDSAETYFNAHPANIEADRQRREGFKVWVLSSELEIRSAVFGEPPCSLRSRIIVANGLDMLVRMSRQHLPDFFLASWTLFIFGVNSLPATMTEAPSRETADALYTNVLTHLGNRTNLLAQEIMREAWKRDPEGVRVVDWRAIIKARDWELLLS